MPAIPNIYDADNKDINDLADTERSARVKMIDAQWEWYDGYHPDVLKVEVGKRNDNIKVNLCGRAIDRAVDFIGEPLRFELPGGVDNVRNEAGELESTKSPEQERLDQMYDDYRDIVPEMFTAGMVGGHDFIKLFFDGEKAAMSLLDPRYVSVFWEMGRGSRARALFYRIQWKIGDTAYRQDIVPGRLIDGSDGWQIIDYEQTRAGKWVFKARDVWEFDFSPIVEIRNRRRPYEYYGVSELTPDVIGLNNSVNFVVTNTGRIIRYHAHPRTIGIGVTADQVAATSIDGFFTVPEGSEIKNLEMQGDLGSSMKFRDDLKAEFFAKIRVVDTSVIKDKLGQVTNFGLRQLFSEQLEMTEERRKDYGAGLAEAFRRMMIMEGLDVPKAPTAVWGDPLPLNRLEVLTAAKMEDELGIASKQSIAADVGRDYVRESQQRAEEKNDASAQLADMLAGFGDRGVFA
jgi:hypothetical protein